MSQRGLWGRQASEKLLFPVGLAAKLPAPVFGGVEPRQTTPVNDYKKNLWLFLPEKLAKRATNFSSRGL